MRNFGWYLLSSVITWSSVKTSSWIILAGKIRCFCKFLLDLALLWPWEGPPYSFLRHEGRWWTGSGPAGGRPTCVDLLLAVLGDVSHLIAFVAAVQFLATLTGKVAHTVTFVALLCNQPRLRYQDTTKSHLQLLWRPGIWLLFSPNITK